MSTRCQVQIRAAGLSWDHELISLYHHWDGYPTHMLPLILKARKFTGEHVSEYQFGRPGHVASYLCASDPSGFECESSADLHGDIAWLYLIEAENKNGGSMAERPVWNVSVYRPGETLETSKLITKGPIEKLAPMAQKIETNEE